MGRPTPGRGASFALIGAAYAVAVAVGAAWLAWGWSSTPLVDALVADVLATLVVFAASRLLGSSSCYDAYWSVAPPLLAAYWWLEREPGADPFRATLVAVVLGLWAVRLTANWARTFPGLPHEDWRYPLLRSRAPRAELLVDLGAIHLVPTLQVFLAMLPVHAVTRSSRPVGWLDGVALVLGLGAVLLELVADGQLRRFTRTARPGEVMDTGVWAWSRHPNYLGELSFWVAMAAFGLAASPGDWWWLVLGALGMAAMLLGASIPMMEERSLARRPAYAEVVARVPRLLPRPPRRSRDRAA